MKEINTKGMYIFWYGYSEDTQTVKKTSSTMKMTITLDVLLKIKIPNSASFSPDCVFYIEVNC